MKRADGWWWRFPVMAALLVGFFVALLPIGWVLAHLSDAMFGVAR